MEKDGRINDQLRSHIPPIRSINQLLRALLKSEPVRRLPDDEEESEEIKRGRTSRGFTTFTKCSFDSSAKDPT